MKRISAFWFAGALLLTCLTAQSQLPKPPSTLEEIRKQLSEHVTHPRFASAMFGVKIVSLDSGKTIFEHNAEKLFSPASNSKLYTVALALDQLGGDYRIKTSLYAESKPSRSGTLKGDLIVYGRGDPTFNTRLNGGDIYQALASLVAVLTNAGVKRISGGLVGDDSFIHGPPYGSGWAWDDMEYYYGAEISALTVNDNTLALSVKPGDRKGAPCKLALLPATTYLILSNQTETVARGDRRTINFHRPIEQNVIFVSGQMPIGDTNYTNDVTVHNPAGLFIAFFKEALARNGIKVSGKLRTVNWLDRQAKPLEGDKWVELGAVESLPMRDIAREIQKPSQNLYTDLILAHVGALEQAERTKRAEPTPNPSQEGSKRSDAQRQFPSKEGLGVGSSESEGRTNAILPINMPQPRSRETSEDAGIRELDAFLAKAGVRRGDVQFEEGSGLSRNNLTTPDATIALLQFMSRHVEAEAYLNALPLAGVDGTLRNRMKNTPAAGNVRAKTGTLRWANSLSGHVTTAAGERLIFSIMLNRYVAGTNPPARGEVDKIAVMLAEFNGRSDE